MAVKIDDFAVRGFAHPHVVDFAEIGQAGGERAKTSRTSAMRSAVASRARQYVGRQRLDMGLDFDAGAEFVAHGVFEPARDVMRGRQRQGAFDFEIGGNRELRRKSSAPRRDGWRGRGRAQSP